MLCGKTESGTPVELPEAYVADRVGEVVDQLKNLANTLGLVRQRQAANTAADTAEWLHVWAQKLDPGYLNRLRIRHAVELERAMQD